MSDAKNKTVTTEISYLDEDVQYYIIDENDEEIGLALLESGETAEHYYEGYNPYDYEQKGEEQSAACSKDSVTIPVRSTTFDKEAKRIVRKPSWGKTIGVFFLCGCLAILVSVITSGFIAGAFHAWGYYAGGGL